MDMHSLNSSPGQATQRMNRRKVTGLGLIGVGAAAGVFWASGRVSHPFAPVVALLLLLAGASFFGKARQFAEKLQPLVGKEVRVRVWGSELPDHVHCSYRVHMVRAFGAGLHFYLHSSSAGSPIHLKVAQPSEATLRDTAVEISCAKYVQWA